MLNTSQTQIKTHKVRTFFASIAGIVAVYLVLASMTVVWLNRTLTDTTTYVNTVAPLVTKPAIQNFVSQKVTEQLLNNVSPQDLAAALLPAAQLTGAQTTDQLKTLLEPVIKANVLQIVQSPSFALLWRTTNQTAHASLVSQLNDSSTEQLTLDLTPTINGVIAELKTTQLSSVIDKINVTPDAGKLTIKNSNLPRFRQYYELFQAGTIAIVVVTILALTLAIGLSVHHAKTVRRILFGVGILALFQALILAAPSFVSLPGNDPVTQGAAKAVVQVLVQNLLIASLVVGGVCIVAAVSSKLYAKFRS